MTAAIIKTEVSLTRIIVTLLVVGFLLYLAQLLPLEATVRRILQAVVVFVLVLWLVQALGIL
jgi:hypothetical protein